MNNAESTIAYATPPLTDAAKEFADIVGRAFARKWHDDQRAETKTENLKERAQRPWLPSFDCSENSSVSD